MAVIEFQEVGKAYDRASWAVRDLNLTIEDGEFMILVGPSGCGKTTALRMLAGLERITAGEIRLGGLRVNDLDPRDRDIAMVFQNYALYPHMDVAGNIGFGLRMRKVPKAETKARTEAAARVLGLTENLRRKPGQLSGGQRQRVAMGRAIVREPQAFLMDEPLSNLDARLRVQMRTEIARIQHDLGVTTVYVTHDQVEAMTMAHRVAVLRAGTLQQVDTPHRIYDAPANLFVASFIGSPSMNVLEATLQQSDGGLTCCFGSHTIPLPNAVLDARPELARMVGNTIAVGFRPEALTAADPGTAGTVTGTVRVVEALGPEVLAYVEINGRSVSREDTTENLANPREDNARVDLAHGDADKTVVVARLPGHADPHPDEPLTLVVNTDKLYFFSLSDGTAIGG